MIALATTSEAQAASSAERRVLLQGVTWGTYVMLRDSLDERGSHARLTYLEGALEIMTASEEHEELKKILARLVEAYAEEADVELNGFGEATFRDEAVERGLEADECYMLGRKKRVPDLAIEIVVSSPLLDKLDVYRGLGVPEVWVYRSGKLTVHVLGARGYEIKARSKALPHLDLDLLVSFVQLGKGQTTLVKAYRAALRGSPKRGRRGRSTKK